jgi:hypothetical protein
VVRRRVGAGWLLARVVLVAEVEVEQAAMQTAQARLGTMR